MHACMHEWIYVCTCTLLSYLHLFLDIYLQKHMLTNNIKNKYMVLTSPTWFISSHPIDKFT